MNRRYLAGPSAALLLLAASRDVFAGQNLRVQVDQNGDFALIGAPIAQDCAAGQVAPLVGAVGNCGTNTTDHAPDVFWRADSPAAGSADANTGITVAQARSSATLTLPGGATVTHAFLYWAATLDAPGVDTQVTFDRLGGASTNVTATQSYQSANNSYQSVADVTAFVQANGPGSYRVSGINVQNLVNLNDNNPYAGWWLAVLYTAPGAPLRDLAIFDGLDAIAGGSQVGIILNGFNVPIAGSDAKLAVVAFEGDNQASGDRLFVNPVNFSSPDTAEALWDAQNPADNFFNGTRSTLGVQTSTAGDLPRLSGGPQSISGMDLDIVDIQGKVQTGAQQVDIVVASDAGGETFQLAGCITSILTARPDFSTSTKSATDVNGGVLLPGDVVEYTIVITNTGNDVAVDTVLNDPLPSGVTYVPGSISVTAGANIGSKTDLSLDDQGEYTNGTRTVTVRLGTGASGLQGGQMAVNESTTVTFQVTIDPGVSGTISNQANIMAAGQLGIPSSTTPTDGNGPASGASPTDVIVEQCITDGECASPTPYCNVATTPNTCVQCLIDTNCPGAAPACNQATNTCMCIASGAEVCDGEDNDCNGSTDEGFNLGSACAVGMGACMANGSTICDGVGGTTCDAMPGQPNPEICGNGIDEDCDGTADDGCSVDSDGDGLSDDFETLIGSDPNDQDSDDDGVVDGQDPNPADDTDGDGIINVLDPDSDNDGLFDGTELGKDCSNSGTDTSKNVCIPDGDDGKTTTSPLDADTDDGGGKDGVEDANHNGVVDAGETDPTAGHGADDKQAPSGCMQDSDCGGPTSGVVCDDFMKLCGPGCRGLDGNGCPEGQTCSSSDRTIGTCAPQNDGDGTIYYDGCVCGFAGRREPDVGWMLLLAGGAAAIRRRRRAG